MYGIYERQKSHKVLSHPPMCSSRALKNSGHPPPSRGRHPPRLTPELQDIRVGVGGWGWRGGGYGGGGGPEQQGSQGFLLYLHLNCSDAATSLRLALEPVHPPRTPHPDDNQELYFFQVIVRDPSRIFPPLAHAGGALRALGTGAYLSVLWDMPRC